MANPNRKVKLAVATILSFTGVTCRKTRPFISPLTLYGHVTGFFMGNLRDFSQIP